MKNIKIFYSFEQNKNDFKKLYGCQKKSFASLNIYFVTTIKKAHNVHT